jgi:polyketide cyclase/dehydrase/lipid transport protein
MIALYIIGGIIVLFLLIAAIAGTAWSYEQSILIQAAPDKIWDNVRSLHAINQWNPWMGIDPNIKVQYAGTDGKPGAGFTWDSSVKNVGAGSQTILRVRDGSELYTRVDFLRPFKSIGYADFKLIPDSNATRVSWSIKSRMPYPVNIVKVFGGIQRNMGRDFTKGLNKLKSLCET